MSSLKHGFERERTSPSSLTDVAFERSEGLVDFLNVKLETTRHEDGEADSVGGEVSFRAAEEEDKGDGKESQFRRRSKEDEEKDAYD